MTVNQRGRLDARTKVLQAALAVAAESAPGPVRVADIAERAGMSAGHVMYYFKSRDVIVAESLLHAEAQLVLRRDRHVAKAADANSALETLVRLYLPTSRADPRWRLWAQLLASPPRDAQTRARFVRVVDSWTGAMAQVILAGCSEGVWACDDAHRMAYQSCRMMDGYALETLLGARGRNRGWAVREVLASMKQAMSNGQSRLAT